MKILSRDFTRDEKALLLLLVIIVIVLAYYLFIYKPVKEGIATANAESENLRSEITIVETKVAKLEKMQSEIDGVMMDENVSVMPSYNNKKAVNAFISDILGNLSYSVTLSNLTRSGDQIRRNIQLEFTAQSYEEMEEVLDRFNECPFRCLIGNVSCSTSRNRQDDTVYSVNMTATFFETLVGGTPDAALPAGD